jgi:putative hydrolase of the HAD superfamily
VKYKDLIFDLYGTLADIHTEESDAVWGKTAIFFGFYGATYTGETLKAAFLAAMQQRQVAAGQNYECFPDIPFEQVMAQLFREKGVQAQAEDLGFRAAQLFRISSMEYIRLYPYVMEALETLRKRGYRLWLLSNAQRVFTAYELRHLGLDDQFDGIYISSDHGCRKPDSRFLGALLQEQGLAPENCMMIGNDRETDIAGAKKAGLATFYMHTNITPPGQAKADPQRHPLLYGGPHWEFEGSDWSKIVDLIQ